MLSVSKPFLGESELQQIKSVFDSGWLGQGIYVTDFESRVAALLQHRHVVAVNSGTSALHLALDAVGVTTGDEVIVPSLTFCATIQVITALGAKPVFCDISPRTLNIDVDYARRLVRSKTKAIVPVHYCGNSCEMDQILALGEASGLMVVEDAAHAFGSCYRGRKIGSFGDITCFSFDPIKTVTCGEGGAVVLSDGHLAATIRRKRVLGMDKDGWQRQGGNPISGYRVTDQGYRYHMSNINAAIGLAQLDRLEWIVAKRREILREYNERLAGITDLDLIDWNIDDTCPFCYIIRVKRGRRDALAGYLRDNGIETGIHYIPNHLQPFFHQTLPLPVTETVFQEILTLPLHCHMATSDVQQVCASVKTFLNS
jgi:perosamine synthetase